MVGTVSTGTKKRSSFLPRYLAFFSFSSTRVFRWFLTVSSVPGDSTSGPRRCDDGEILYRRRQVLLVVDDATEELALIDGVSDERPAAPALFSLGIVNYRLLQKILQKKMAQISNITSVFIEKRVLVSGVSNAWSNPLPSHCREKFLNSKRLLFRRQFEKSIFHIAMKYLKTIKSCTLVTQIIFI